MAARGAASALHLRARTQSFTGCAMVGVGKNNRKPMSCPMTLYAASCRCFRRRRIWQRKIALAPWTWPIGFRFNYGLRIPFGELRQLDFVNEDVADTSVLVVSPDSDDFGLFPYPQSVAEKLTN
jgi:hypothetical protein